jgi:hypothetical protein
VEWSLAVVTIALGPVVAIYNLLVAFARIQIVRRAICVEAFVAASGATNRTDAGWLSPGFWPLQRHRCMMFVSKMSASSIEN